MAPKAGKNVPLQEEKLQAVVLTDSYETRFLPLTQDKPRCLLPLANTPLIEYTLEFLATAGVDEIYLMCCAHADQIDAYIKKTKWQGADSPLRIKVIASPESQSVGDVMRDLDTKGVIKRDFVLISGDVVSNMDFQRVLDAHNDRKKHDKNAIMTMVLREAGGGLHRTRPRNEPGIFILDEKTNRCLRYEVAKLSDAISLDAEVLTEHESVSFRNDLIDCQIDICTVDVPALFSENFDYDKIRYDFVRGILTSDLLGKTIHAHIINDMYAARVQSLQTYDAISRDLIGRFVYPIAPDSNLQDHYSYTQGHIYKERGVVLAQSTHLKSNCVIGRDTKIGQNTTVFNSTIGKNCVIGDNVELRGAYVWDNTVLEDNVLIENSIVAGNARIKQGCKITHNCVISYNVVVGEGIELQEAKLCATGTESDTVGPDGQGCVYTPDDEWDGDDEGESELVTDGLVMNMSHLNLSDVSIASVEEKHHSQSHGKKRGHRRNHSGSYNYDSESGSEDDDEGENFISEAIASIQRAMAESHDVDTATLELNTLRMTMNASYEEVREATITTLMHDVMVKINTGGMKVNQAVINVFKAWSQLLKKQIFEDDDEVHMINMIMEQSVKRKHYSEHLFMWAVKTLYDEDILDEDNIIAWANSERGQCQEWKPHRAQFDKLLDWLQNAESESESE